MWFSERDGELHHEQPQVQLPRQPCLALVFQKLPKPPATQSEVELMQVERVRLITHEHSRCLREKLGLYCASSEHSIGVCPFHSHMSSGSQHIRLLGDSSLAVNAVSPPLCIDLDFHLPHFVTSAWNYTKTLMIWKENNQTWVNEVLLLGFQNLQGFRVIVFLLLLFIYVLAICGNLLIITLVSNTKSLHTPMYFFLVQLSVSDIMLTTTIVPNMLYLVLNKEELMYFVGCFIQFYFFGVSECSECLHLTVMSYDRYLAICSPLRYSTLMQRVFCQKLVSLSWILSLCVMWLEVITISMLRFCGNNIIDHFFCDLFPLLDLSCSDTSMVQLEIVLLSIPVLVFPFVFIIISYIFIISSILKIPSITGRHKAFSTCSSHLTVVSLFYGTLFSSYVLPTRDKSVNGKVLPLLYTVMTPLINPIIYSLRNKEMKNALDKFLSQSIS
ncbi:olfactory receptor 11L1-like [Engystomops pustulosus]|uniref:olfactory receptor 11L1-like n=1 Tax=Engystomops pustulosus TaxID=76066 RepID=UPI003AFB0680